MSGRRDYDQRLKPGHKQYYLTVIKFHREVNNGKQRPGYLVLCDCGKEKWVAATDYERGSLKSCGCKKAEGRVASFKKTMAEHEKRAKFIPKEKFE